MRLNRLVLIVAWCAGGTLTVLHGFHPGGYALRSPSSSAVFETIAASGALLVSAMTYGRWRQSRMLGDGLACYAFTTLATGNVLFVLLPLVANTNSVRPAVRAAAFACGAFAAGLLAAATVLADRPTRVRPTAVRLALVVVTWVAAVGALGWVARDSLPGLSEVASTEASGSGGVAVTVVQALSALAFALASIKLALRSAKDGFFGWLAVSAVLWAFARANYAITPAHQVNWINVGDWLRLSAYLVAVVAVAVELNLYWRRVADNAVLEERHRIARDMHDGLAQELAFIVSQTQSLAGSKTSPRAKLVARSAERALDESRRAIAALTRAVDEPLDVALTQEAEDVGGRLGIRVVLDVEPVPHVAPDTREALLRIMREAVTNAGRHGRAKSVHVALANHHGVSLRVSDDGCGFRVDDPAVFAGDRWGITSMRERAEALGGRFSVESRPYWGTRVEVWVP